MIKDVACPQSTQILLALCPGRKMRLVDQSHFIRLKLGAFAVLAGDITTYFKIHKLLVLQRRTETTSDPITFHIIIL